MSLLLLVALLAEGQYGPPRALPPREQPALVRQTIAALRGGDGAAIDRLFPSRATNAPEPGRYRPLSGAEAVEMLRGCTLSKAWLLHKGAYVVDYACPARRKAAKGCATGDRSVTVNMERELSFTLNEGRRVGSDCPIYVPPPPPR